MQNNFDSDDFILFIIYCVSGELFIFYGVFYIILVILFAICMRGLMYTIDEKVPKWTLSESRIGINPGLGFRPMPKNKSQGSLIWMDTKNLTSVKTYVEMIDAFLSRMLFEFKKKQQILDWAMFLV